MVPDDIVAALPARSGHFVMESGYHTDRWLTLDALFVDPHRIAPLVEALAARIRTHAVTAVCGPLLGGAFLAQVLAGRLESRFYFTQPDASRTDSGLFSARYRLPPALIARVRGERVAVVDDVISAGSSVRATIASLADAGASTVVVGVLLILGDTGAAYFDQLGIPVEALGRGALNLWTPDDCPLCRSGQPLDDPRDR